MYDLNKDPMAEERIERHVERMFNRLDRQFMGGHWTQLQYDEKAKEIGAWADSEYRRLKTFG